MRLNAAESWPISSPRRHRDRPVEPAGLDLAGTFQQPQHRPVMPLPTIIANTNPSTAAIAVTIAEIQIACRCSANDGRGARMHLIEHVGADAVDLAIELLAQRVGLDERPPRLVEIVRIELLQQPRVLLVKTMAEIVDRVLDAVVETPERGIVRRRRSVLDDRRDLLARFLRLTA